MSTQQTLATALHYPQCWDTAAYPTLESAIDEAAAWFRCSVCTPDAIEPEPRTLTLKDGTSVDLGKAWRVAS